MKLAHYRIRVRIIFLVIIIFTCLLLYRLYTVQVIAGDDFAQLAERQYIRPDHHRFDRGNIFFTSRTGEQIPAATLKHGYVLAINPSQIEDARYIYDSLKDVVSIDEKTFFERAGKTDDPYEEVAKRLDLEQADMIEALDLEGVYLYRQQWRYYPGKSMAAGTIGFLGYQGDELAGRYGLESSYEHVLAQSGDARYANFFAELFLNIKHVVLEEEYDRADVVTTIDPQVQSFLEITLTDINNEYRSDQTGGIIMDPKTGKIVAMGVVPSFDLNNFQEEEDERIFANPLVENVYEMGSIVKPLTIASGLDAGVITAQTTYYDAGYIDLNGYTIKNYDGKSRGTVPVQEILNQSLNTGVTFIMQKMGIEKFSQYMRGYGLGEKTGIELPNETAGLISNLDSPREVEHATASFGQGIALTPLAMTRALAVLANGGILVNPYLVDVIKKDGALVEKIDHGEGKRVLKQETSEEITRMLVEVVDEALLGGNVALKNHTIAAKTGTAQIADPHSGGYYEDRFLHSFFGYFPAFEPKYIVFLYTVEPKGVKYASQTLTHPFIDITKYLINYYDIAPDR